MLFGKNFGGRHQRYLGAGTNGLQCRQRRHHGFSGADVTLNESKHGQRLAKILTDVGQHMTLGTGECERQGIQKTLGQVTRGQEW